MSVWPHPISWSTPLFTEEKNKIFNDRSGGGVVGGKRVIIEPAARGGREVMWGGEETQAALMQPLLSVWKKIFFYFSWCRRRKWNNKKKTFDGIILLYTCIITCSPMLPHLQYIRHIVPNTFFRWFPLPSMWLNGKLFIKIQRLLLILIPD
jgi:hypothetical protein